MGKNKIAVIDLGTNTFHILVARVDNKVLDIILREKRVVKIGQGGINKGIITDEAKERAMEALKYFKAIIDEHKITRIFATATSAIRNASNGKQLVNDIKKETGIEVNIISGIREARYIYDAVNKAVNIGNEISLIMDIGGGSVEFIICDKNKIYWQESYEIGAQRLLDLFHYHDPIIEEEIINLANYLKEKLNSLIKACIKFKPTTLIGSSGSFDTLSDIFRLRNNIHKEDYQTELPLDISSFLNICDEVTQKNKKDRMQIPGMVEMRVDMIVVACILVKYVISSCKIDKIRVSSYSLKEGVLFNTLAQLGL